MTDNDPGATFRADQADAASRDQKAWEVNIRNGEAQAAQIEMGTALLAARGAMFLAIAGAIRVATALVFVAAVFIAVVVAFR